MAMSLLKVVAGLRVVAAVGAVVAGVMAQGAGPSGRWGHASTYDTGRGATILFGGRTVPSFFGDTWQFKDGAWMQLPLTVAPPARAHGALCHDPIRGHSLLFGGLPTGDVNGQLFGDTWLLSATGWTQANPANAPSPRIAHSMSYDSLRNRIVLFGGWSSNGPQGDTWEFDGANWLQNAATGPSARRGHAMAYDAQSGLTVLFGGNPSVQFDWHQLNDTWTWNGTAWLQISPANSPAVRETHGMYYDSARSRIVLHGGSSGPTSSTVMDETWTWDGSNWQPSPTALRPPLRQWTQNTLSFDPIRAECILFGGVVPSGPALNDTWLFDGSQWSPAIYYTRSPINGNLFGLTPPLTWQQAEAVAVQEGGHLATIRNTQENAWLTSTFANQATMWIGLSDATTEGAWAWSSNEPLNFTRWVGGGPDNFNNQDYGVLLSSGFWDDQCPYGSCVNPGIIEIPGGLSSTITATNLPTTAPPPATSFHTLAPTPTGSALLFGGNTANLPQPFTYTLTGTSWSKAFSILNPMARTDATLLLNPARSNNVLFGGRNAAGTALGDTWTWAAGQWTYLTPATAPAPRHGHRMAFDRVANVGLLFGGKDATGAELSDFWSWNGTTWAQLTPATLPPARANHGMAYDDLRNRTVVFGGKSGSSRLADVWEWDGAAWTDVTPQGTPAWGPDARDGHAMAYDPRAERVVLHGGETASGCQQDVWSWNGTEWTIHLAQSGSVPSARTGSQLIHDNGTNRMLLFAGGCGTSYTNDLWQLSLPTFARATSYGSPCVGSRGPLTLSVINDSLPIIGQTFQMEMSNVPTFSPCAGLLGFSNTELNGVPLPFDLAFLSMPGCNAYMSKDLNFALPAPNNVLNTTAWDLAIPLDPVFLSLHIYLQGLALELFGGGRFATVTNGVDARIGDR